MGQKSQSTGKKAAPAQRVAAKNAAEDNGWQTQVFSKTNVLLIVGLAMLIAWRTMLFTGASLYSGSDNPERTLDAAALLNSFALIGVYALYAFRPAWMDALRAKRCMPVVLACGMFASTLCITHANTFEGAALVVVGGVLSGVSLSTLFMLYGLRCLVLDHRHIIAICATAFGLSSMLFAGFALAPTPSALPLTLAASLIPGGLLALGAKDGAGNPTSPGGSHAAPQSGVGKRQPQSETIDAKTFGRFIAIIVIWGFINEFVHTTIVSVGRLDTAEGLPVFMQPITSTIVVLAALLILIGVTLLPKSFKLSRAYRLALLLLLVSTMLLPLSSDRIMRAVSYSIATGSSTLISMTAWILNIAYAKSNTSQPPARTLAVAYLFWELGPFCGAHAASLAFPHVSAGQLQITWASILLACGLVFAYLSVFTESEADDLTKLFPSKRRAMFKERCIRIGRQYNLTEREVEVMSLLAKGRNASFIQDALFISYGTVATHRKHVYQKLSVHSQQELMDLIDKAK